MICEYPEICIPQQHRLAWWRPQVLGIWTWSSLDLTSAHLRKVFLTLFKHIQIAHRLVCIYVITVYTCIYSPFASQFLIWPLWNDVSCTGWVSCMPLLCIPTLPAMCSEAFCVRRSAGFPRSRKWQLQQARLLPERMPWTIRHRTPGRMSPKDMQATQSAAMQWGTVDGRDVHLVTLKTDKLEAILGVV